MSEQGYGRPVLNDGGYEYQYTPEGSSEDKENILTTRFSSLPEFPGYTTLSILGKGSFGEVYLGEEESTGDKVALKTIKIRAKSGFPAKGILKLAEREVNTLKEIQPRCVPYLACFRDSMYFEDTQVYLVVMDYVEGTTIDNFNLRPGKEARDLLLILNDLTEALQYIHSLNLIHNDIKPDNIKITPDFIPVLLDFGLSCVKDKICPIDNTELSCCSRAIGSYRPFTPPEGIKKGIVGPSSDVWELALTIYVIIANYPFGLQKWDDKVSKQFLEIVSNNILNGDINPMYTYEEIKSDPDKYVLNNIVMRGLDKDPTTRITLDEIREELDKYFNEYPIGQ